MSAATPGFVDRLDENLGARLSDIARLLAKPRETIEHCFLEMGDRLSACTKLLNDIAEAHEGMPGELESAEFLAAARSLKAIRDQVDELAATLASEEDQTGRLVAMAEGVAAPLAVLNGTVRAIRLIAVNARIAAASLHGKDEEAAVFTSDMMSLGKDVGSAVAAFMDAYERLSTILTAARAVRAAFNARHGDTLRNVAGRLAGHLSAVEAYHARAAGRANEHGKSTGLIRSRVSAAVLALQSGDSTRQRIEHIELGIKALEEDLAGRVGGGSSAHGDTVAAVCRLQAAQLDETIGEFDARAGDLARSLRELVGDAAAVVRAGNEEAETLLADGDSALGAMSDDLRRIGALFEDFEKMRAELEVVACDVGGSARGMIAQLNAVRQIEQQIRLLSLNTAIQCDRVGSDGGALRVIAQSLRERAGETMTAAGVIMSAIGDAEAAIQALTEERSLEITAKIAVLEQGADEATTLLEIVAGRLRDRAAIMAEAGPRATGLLRQAAESVSELRDFGASWLPAQEALELLATSHRGPLELAATDEALIARLRSHYTMDGERRVHDRLFGRSTDDAGSLSPSEREESLDGIFF